MTGGEETPFNSSEVNRMQKIVHGSVPDTPFDEQRRELANSMAKPGGATEAVREYLSEDVTSAVCGFADDVKCRIPRRAGTRSPQRNLRNVRNHGLDTVRVHAGREGSARISGSTRQQGGGGNA
jgi:hypothetical protein